MRTPLKVRLERLEAVVTTPPTRLTEAQQAECCRHVDAMMARFEAEEQECSSQDPRLRLAGWCRTVTEYEATLANGGKTDPPSPPNPTVVNPAGMDALRLQMAKACLPDARWHRLEAQLAILQEAGYSTPDIEALRREHQRFQGTPWQWQGEDLPEEAGAHLRLMLEREG